MSQDIIYLIMLFFWYSEQKCTSSQKYASENGLPIMKNVLLPKSKGFCACLGELRDSMDAGTHLHYFHCNCYASSLLKFWHRQKLEVIPL